MNVIEYFCRAGCSSHSCTVSRRIGSQNCVRFFFFFFVFSRADDFAVVTNIRFNKLIINLGIKRRTLWLNWARHLSPLGLSFLFFYLSLLPFASSSSHVRFHGFLLRLNAATLPTWHCLFEVFFFFSLPFDWYDSKLLDSRNARSRPNAAIQFILFTFSGLVLAVAEAAAAAANLCCIVTHAVSSMYQSSHSNSAANSSRSIPCIQLLTNSKHMSTHTHTYKDTRACAGSGIEAQAGTLRNLYLYEICVFMCDGKQKPSVVRHRQRRSSAYARLERNSQKCSQ